MVSTAIAIVPTASWTTGSFNRDGDIGRCHGIVVVDLRPVSLCQFSLCTRCRWIGRYCLHHDIINLQLPPSSFKFGCGLCRRRSCFIGCWHSEFVDMVVSAGRHCVIQNQLKLKIFVQEKTFEVIVVDKSQDPSPAVDGPPLASADCLLSSTMLSPSCLPIAKCKLADEDSLFRLKCRSVCRWSVVSKSDITTK